MSSSFSAQTPDSQKREMTSKHFRKYREVLLRARDGTGASMTDATMFEYAWALELEMLLYDDVPPDFVHHLVCKRDFGTDLISLDGKVAAQVKHYLHHSVDHCDLAKFFMHARGNLKCEILILCTTPQANLTLPAQDDIRGGGIQVRRASLRGLVDKHLGHGEPLEKKQRVTVAESPLVLRKGQMGLRKAFSEHSDPTPFRAQLPCGYGKTTALGLVLRDDLEASGATFRCLVLVPWIDLLWQSENTLRSMLPQARFAVLGGGNSETPRDFDVLISTHASLPRIAEELKDVPWSLVALDEAHHCQDGTDRRKFLAGLDFRRTLELSATFPWTMKPDFHVSLREAIDEGFVSDYRIHIIELSEGDRIFALVDLFSQRRVEWGATLAAFTSKSRAEAFVEGLEARDIEAALVTADTGGCERRQVMRRLEEGELAVVACIGVWNEGVDIPRLHTVLFADNRNSCINKRQLSQRAGRTHHTKPYARVVLAVQQGIEDIEDIMLAFLKEDRALCTALRDQQGGVAQNRLRLETFGRSEAEVISESTWSSLGRILDKIAYPSVEQKCLWLAEHFSTAPPSRKAQVVKENNGAPYTFRAGFFWSNVVDNWLKEKTKTKLSPQQIQELEADCPWISDAVDFILQKRTEKPQGEPSMEQKCLWLAKHFSTAPPSRKEFVVEYNGAPYTFKVGGFWSYLLHNLLGEKAHATLSPRQIQELKTSCPWISDAIATLLQKRSKKPRGEPSFAQKCAWLTELFSSAPPTRKAEKVKEYDGASYTFRAGWFLNTLVRNWLGEKATPSPKQKQKLQADCPWISALLKKRTAKTRGGPSIEQ